MGQQITCTHIGTYPLTRGQQYELLACSPEQQFVKIRDNAGRRHWYSAEHFDLSGAPVPVLTAWRFDDPVVDEINKRDETDNWVDIRLQFTDGSLRWCQMMTPDFLKRLVDDPIEPMFNAANLLVVRDLHDATVEQVLLLLDQRGELQELSHPLDSEETDDLEQTDMMVSDA